MIVNLYLVQRFLVALGGVTTGIFVLYFLVEVERHISSYGDLEFTPLEIVGLTILKAPQSIYAVLPTIVAISALWMSLRLSTTSEMPVIRSFGKSGMSALATPAFVAALLGLFAVAVVNPVISAMSKKHRELVTQSTDAGTEIFIEEDGLVWLRQVVDNRQTVIRSSSTRGGIAFSDVHVFMFDPDGRPTKRIHASSAELVDDLGHEHAGSDSELPSSCQASGPGFSLEEWMEWDHRSESRFATTQPAEPAVKCLVTKLTPDQIRESLDPPNTVSFWKIRSLIDRLEEAGFSSTLHRIYMQSEMAKPLYFASMVLLGGCFALRQKRSTNMPAMVAVTVVLIFAAIILGNFAQVMGESEEISVSLAAWLPPFVVLLFSLGALFYLEDG